MFVALGCLAVLAMSAPACDADAVEYVPAADERAAPVVEGPEAPTPATPLIVPSDADLSDPLESAAIEELLPPPSDVYIEDVMPYGLGCPNVNSTLVDIDSDRKSFLVIFKDMLLLYPGGSPVKTINCVASVKLHIPQGWQVSVATINTRGYAFLEKGLRARNTTNYFFAGNPVGYEAHTELKGPYDNLYVFTDQIPFQSVVWSPCGTSAIFAIDTSLVLNALGNPWGVGIMNNTTLDGRFQKLLHLQWKKC